LVSSKNRVTSRRAPQAEDAAGGGTPVLAAASSSVGSHDRANVVVGTSGLREEDYVEIDTFTRSNNVECPTVVTAR